MGSTFQRAADGADRFTVFIVVPDGMTNTSDERVVITSDMASARETCDQGRAT